MKRASSALIGLELELDALKAKHARVTDQLERKTAEVEAQRSFVHKTRLQLQDRYVPELEKYLPDFLCLLISSYDTFTPCLDCGEAYPRSFTCLSCVCDPAVPCVYKPCGPVLLTMVHIFFDHRQDREFARYVYSRIQDEEMEEMGAGYTLPCKTRALGVGSFTGLTIEVRRSHFPGCPYYTVTVAK